MTNQSVEEHLVILFHLFILPQVYLSHPHFDKESFLFLISLYSCPYLDQVHLLESIHIQFRLALIFTSIIDPSLLMLSHKANTCIYFIVNQCLYPLFIQVFGR